MCDRVHPRRNVAKRPLEVLAARHAQELVGIEGEHEVRALVAQRFPRDIRNARRLEERGLPVPDDAQRQALSLQLAQDLCGPVERPVIDNREAVERFEIVADEGFDHVRLVAHHRHAPEPHARHLCLGVPIVGRH